jgi:hypothetical protein
MRRIDSFTFYRDKPDGEQINQEIIRDATPIDDTITQLECQKGTELCWFETVLKSDFFYAPGMIQGFGEAWLQFGRSPVRRKRQLAVDMSRSLQVSGGFANADSIEVQIFGIPLDENLFKAEAYHCDDQNRRVEIDPVKNGESVRVCVAPTAEALNATVRIQSLESWNFTRDLIMQPAIEGNAATEKGGSVFWCRPGSRVCAFHTILEPDFFPSIGVADGNGMVKLMFGGYVPGRADVSSTRRRQLQIADIIEIPDDLAAGLSPVELPTPLDYEAPEIDDACYYEHEFHEWWLEEDSSSKYTIIGSIIGILGATAGCFLCLWLCPPFCWMQRDEYVEKGGNGSDIKVNVDVKKDSSTETSHNATTAAAKGTEAEEEILQPRKSDVVFGDNEWPGTLDFFETVRRVAEANPDEEYRPSIYREIKRNSTDYEYYSKDVENGTIKRSSKPEIIALIGKMFSEARILMRDNKNNNRSDQLPSRDTTEQLSSTETTAPSSYTMSRTGSNRSMFSLSSSGSLMHSDYNGTPDKSDIVFEDQNHTGTQKFTKRVLKVAREFPDEVYRPSIYRKIKRPFEENRFLVKDNEGRYIPARKKELVTLIGKAFDEAKIQIKHENEMGSIDGSIVIDPQTAEQVSVLGENESVYPAAPATTTEDLHCLRSRSSSRRNSRDLRGDGSNGLRSRSSSRRSLRDLSDDNRDERPRRSSSNRSLRNLDNEGSGRMSHRSSSNRSLRNLENEESGRMSRRSSRSSLRDNVEESGSGRMRRHGSNRSLRRLDDDKSRRHGDISRPASAKSLVELDEAWSKDTSRSKRGKSRSHRRSRSLRDVEDWSREEDVPSSHKYDDGRGSSRGNRSRSSHKS